MGWTPPHEQYSASDKSCFAYESTVRRYPRILTQIIDDVNSRFDDCEAEKLAEAKKLISDIAALKYEIAHDRELVPLDDDNGSNLQIYNDELALLQSSGIKTWFQMPWLYGESYLYRRLRMLFARAKHWTQHDPFARSKLDTFASAAPGVYALALMANNLILADSAKTASPQALQAEFYELAQVALWGNATDLSLLQGLSHADIQALQKTGKAAQEAAQHLILQNNLEEAWTCLSSLKGARIDIVLDNAGFELYGDLILADWLVSTSFCSEVVFHPKDIPWYVSDVMPQDLDRTLEALSDPSFFKTSEGEQLHDEVHRSALSICVSRWKTHLATGKFKFSLSLGTNVDETIQESRKSVEAYWTNPYSFGIIPEKSPELLSELQKADLVIFKGDLNYRKLTSDARWATTTPFSETLGPLKGQLNILSLRTIKADVCVGLEAGVAERLDKDDPTWRVSGKYAVIAFAPKN